MSESGDYSPAPWAAAESFEAAQAHYQQHASRSYEQAVSRGETTNSLLPDSIETDASAVIVIDWDETGSMGDRPGICFGKLGFLHNELNAYFGPDHAVCFGAHGDATGGKERFPVQMRPAAADADLQPRLKELVIEGEGGGEGSLCESAELTALYVARNIKTPNCARPIYIIVTDEKAYSEVDRDRAKRWAKVNLGSSMSTKALFDELKRKWAVYVIQMPYFGRSDELECGDNRKVHLFWKELVGEKYHSFCTDPDRVVDCILGIFAEEAGMVVEYYEELRGRQLPDKNGAKKVALVTQAMRTIHAGHDPNALPVRKDPTLKKLPGPGDIQHSVTRRPAGGGPIVRGKSLLGDDDDEE
jgi:hypothetical protein